MINLKFFSPDLTNLSREDTEEYKSMCVAEKETIDAVFICEDCFRLIIEKSDPSIHSELGRVKAEILENIWFNHKLASDRKTELINKSVLKERKLNQCLQV